MSYERGSLWKQEKWSSLALPRLNCLNELGCQIRPIDDNFHLQKSCEIFDKNSADKIWSKKDKEWKVSPLMAIKVNRKIIWSAMQEILKICKHRKERWIWFWFPPVNVEQ